MLGALTEADSACARKRARPAARADETMERLWKRGGMPPPHDAAPNFAPGGL